MLAAIQFLVLLVVVYVYKMFLFRSTWFADRMKAAGPMAEFVSSPAVICYGFLIYLHFSVDWVYAGNSVLGLYDPNISVLPWVTSGPRTVNSTIPENLCIAVREMGCKHQVCIADSCDEQALAECTSLYPNPCDVMRLNGVIRVLVLLSPPCVAVSVVISAVHTWKHLKHGRPWTDRRLSPLHQFAIQIVFLAPVYGFFALMSVASISHLLEGRPPMQDAKLFLNGSQLNDINLAPKDSWLKYIELTDRWYSLNFIVADLYEARALYCFTVVCMKFINMQRKRRGIFSHSCEKCGAKCPECEGVNNTISHMLFMPLKRMTLLGVQCFVWTNFFRCVYVLGMEQIRESSPKTWRQIAGSLQTLGDVDSFFEGFTLCVSSIAIWNLVTFEHYLTDVLEEFEPKLKFWSAKIIVSLAFIQSIVIGQLAQFMPKDSDYLYYQQQLAYACLMCIEMLPVALLQLPAWNPVRLELNDPCEPEGEGKSNQIEFTVSRGKHLVRVSVEENAEDNKTFWRSASVTLLSGAMEKASP